LLTRTTMNRSIHSSSLFDPPGEDHVTMSNDENNDGGDGMLLQHPPPMEKAMVCTSVVEIGAKVCFATYNEEEEEIIIEESPCSGNDFAVVAERYFALVRPNLLLLGNSIVTNEGFLEVLTKPIPTLVMDEGKDTYGKGDGVNNTSSATGSSNAEASCSIPYRVLKSAAFDVRNGMALILDHLRVESLIRRSGNRRQARDDPVRQFPTSNRTFAVSPYHMLGSVIDLDSQLQVKAVGALLSFLQSTIFKLDGQITVNKIRHAKSSKYMHLSGNTISSLSIFSTDHHPLLASKGRGNSKEGSSLFSLLDRTKSRGGRQMLRQWMLQPLLDREELLARQDGVDFFVNPLLENCESAAGAILSLLQQVGPVNQILNRIMKCVPLPSDFVALTRTLSAAHEICKVLSFELLERLKPFVPPLGMNLPPGVTDNEAGRAERGIRFLQDILRRCNTPVLCDLEERICACVDEDSTYEARDTVCIRPGFSEELDQLKTNYSRLNGMWSESYSFLNSRNGGNLILIY